MSWKNARAMQEAMAAATPKKLRAYEWCRLRNDFLDLPLWRVVARRSKSSLSQVQVVVLRLEALANKSLPRGSIADMSIDEFAAALDLRPDIVARIRAALEEPGIGWIDQDHVVDFCVRNPDDDDPTMRKKNAERQARFRAKRKVQTDLDIGTLGQPPPLIHSNVTSRRDSVTVTPRSDQIKNFDGDAFSCTGDIVAGSSQGLPKDEEIVDFGKAELWLRTEGWKLVTERMRVLRSKAEQLIARWHAELDRDVVTLVRIMRAAITANVVADQFEQLVQDQIDRHRVDGQRSLAFGPRPVSNRGSA